MIILVKRNKSVASVISFGNNWQEKTIFTAPYFPNGVFVLLTVAPPGGLQQLKSGALTQTPVPKNILTFAALVFGTKWHQI